LKQIGVPEPYYKVSFPDGAGLAELKQALFGKIEEKERQE
jgi:hypothetical protein